MTRNMNLRTKARVLFIAVSATLALMTILSWWHVYNATGLHISSLLPPRAMSFSLNGSVSGGTFNNVKGNMTQIFNSVQAPSDTEFGADSDQNDSGRPYSSLCACKLTMCLVEHL